jgi:hypothetical protein
MKNENECNEKWTKFDEISLNLQRICSNSDEISSNLQRICCKFDEISSNFDHISSNNKPNLT